MEKPNDELLEEEEGLEDFLCENYPKNCFDPNDYFDKDLGYFKKYYGPVPAIPPIKRLLELEQIEEDKKIDREIRKEKAAERKAAREKEKMLTLTQCPVCRHMISPKRFENHYKNCVEKEKMEKEENEKKKENGNRNN